MNLFSSAPLRFVTCCFVFLSSHVGANASCDTKQGSLSSREWSWRRVRTLQVMSASGHQQSDPEPRSLSFRSSAARLCGVGGRPGECRPGGPLADLITSGTFHDGSGLVLGPTMRRGHLDQVITSDSKVYGRGAVAVFQDGRASICHPASWKRDLTVEVLSQVCARGSSRLHELMGGGALLIHQGLPACSDGAGLPDCQIAADLYRVQHFDQGGRGLASAQLRSTHHLVLAQKRGSFYALWNRVPKSGSAIQRELCAAGFSDALKLDGGSGFFVRSERAGTFGSGRNPSGFLVDTESL